MTLISKGYCADSFSAYELNKDWQLFSKNIALILDNQQKILETASYFFCQPCFAMCSWPYVNGDGVLSLGYLLLGWRSGNLVEVCSNCSGGKVLITSFAGSPLSGRNSWTGICYSCCQKQGGEHSSAFRQWVDFILKLRQTFPATVEQIEEYQGQEFTWGGNGLKPVTKRRIVSKPVAKSVVLELLIAELKAGNIRHQRPISISLLKRPIELKPFSRR
jgi:hypothetical protein